MNTHTPGYEITFDGFGFNDAKDPYKRRLSTLPATWKDEGARQQFGHEVVRAVNTHAQLLEALKAMHTQMTHFADAWTSAGVGDIYEEVVSAAEKAIAQAEGKD